MNPNVVVVLGTRPTFIDMAPIVKQLVNKCNLMIYHTGQHYDEFMSEIFFKQLELPEPYLNMETGSGSQAIQTARILVKTEKALSKDKPDFIIVKGDTNTALAPTITAAKLKIPIIHIEAGCRTLDKTLPEEINRVVISNLATYHYPATENCKNNLLREGISEKRIRTIGHPVVDVVDMMKPKLRDIKGHCGRTVNIGKYYYVSMHRDFNVDVKETLQKILDELVEIASRMQIVFTVHPRTKQRLEKFGLTNYLYKFLSTIPVDYITSLSFIRNSYGIITDSGGLTKESAMLGKPVISLRDDQEWIETMNGDCNQLAFSNGSSITKCIQNLELNYDKINERCKMNSNIFGEVGISKKIVSDILQLYHNGEIKV